MQNELIEFFSKIRNPLLYASKNNFANLEKVKNLNELVSDSCILILSELPPGYVRKKVNKLKDIFSNFNLVKSDKKKEIIINALKILNDLNEIDHSSLKDKLNNNQVNIENIINKDIRYLKGIGPVISSALNKRSIFTIDDLMFYPPRRYDDRRKISKISELVPDKNALIKGKILVLTEVKNKKVRFFQIIIDDGSASLKLIWFNYKSEYLRSVFKKGSEVIVYGNVTLNSFDRYLQIIHPLAENIEIIDNSETDSFLQFNRIVPVYPLTEGLTQRKLRKIIHSTVQQYSHLFNNLISVELQKRNRLIDIEAALKNVHFPDEYEIDVDFDNRSTVHNSLPHRTLIFFEFFVLELGIAYKKRMLEKRLGISFNEKSIMVEKLIKKLPFNLTKSQNKVIEEIKNDMTGKYPMNRLLQGDVGSGKTVVALISILNAIESGYQAVMMVPTEILADQHYSNIKSYTGELINIGILKSSLTRRDKKNVYNNIENGTYDLIIGTHALFQEGVNFSNLGLIVIDEQHRFGVLQRASLLGKAANPDVLIMTATPIPRTLAITVYGDLNVSVIDQLPPNRKKINTISIRDNKKNRAKLYEFLRKELNKGKQAYVVCPFIDESENPDFKNISYATKTAEILKNDLFPDYKIALLHGRMSRDEKEDVMSKFLLNEYQILVSTTVIEVGVDVPNATVMVIENAERFGLSQLHQLRGRIGRGEDESTCFLISSYRVGEDSLKRINIMVESNDGFRISEADLELRGPGDFMGTKQSGIPAFKFANLVSDTNILNESRELAFDIINNEDMFKKHKKLFKYVVNKWGEMLEISSLS